MINILLQTRPTQMVKVYFLMKNRVFTDFFILLVQKINYLHFLFRFNAQ